ncbi:MAG TPA: carboxylate-amine ligase, partial [Candidatus Udaeobacter sp.]|nr:carboxylate-amine ligase [Candidatus Udaeobacter sp.]
LRRSIIELARRNGMRVAAAGTHPFSHWADVGITPDARYAQIVADFQVVARANLIFGLHVHVGIEDRDDQIHLMNAARYFLPHLLALTANSPFWLGHDTGWHSYRSKIFDKFPRTNIPDFYGSYGEYESYIQLLLKTNSIRDRKQVWFDIRPHPYFSTLEFRVCDIPMRAEESIAIAALVQALTAKLWKLLNQNLGFRLYRRALIMENKWRAGRYGMGGKLIDFRKEEEVAVPLLIEEILEFVDDVLDELGSRAEVEKIRWIVANGNGAHRQLEVYQKTGGDFRALMDFVCSETEIGLDTDAPMENLNARVTH